MTLLSRFQPEYFSGFMNGCEISNAKVFFGLTISHYQSHWIRNFRFFFPYFGFFPLLGKFERHCPLVIRIFQCFSSHNPEKFRQKTLEWEWWRLRRSFMNLTEWCERRVTCQQLIGDIKHTWKNTIRANWLAHKFEVVFRLVHSTLRTCLSLFPENTEPNKFFPSKIFI